MEDSDFKNMNHIVGTGNSVSTNGGQVSAGYLPDLTIKNNNSSQIIFIIESEQKTDRKAILGDLIKAEKYAQDNNYNPKLIIVMKEFSNTTVQQIADHLKLYLDWVNNGFCDSAKIQRVHILSDSDYLASNTANEVIGSSRFLNRGVEISFP